jgi:hypothetical protein
VRRASAVERCGGLPEDLLFEIITRLLMQYHKQVAWRWASFLVGAVGVVSLAYLLQGNALFIYGILGLAVTQHLILTNRHTGRSLQALLQNSEDRRLIPILLMKYSTADGSAVRPQHSRVRDLGLTQLLPYVAQSDDGMWTRHMRTRLAALLRSPLKNDAMTHGIIYALSQVGDEAALPDLLQLSEPHPEHSNRAMSRHHRANPEDLREAAVECIGAIRVRVSRRLQQTILLRACATDVPLSLSLPRSIEVDAYRADLELTRPAAVHAARPTTTISPNVKPTNTNPIQEVEEQCQG